MLRRRIRELPTLYEYLLTVIDGTVVKYLSVLRLPLVQYRVLSNFVFFTHPDIPGHQDAVESTGRETRLTPARPRPPKPNVKMNAAHGAGKKPYRGSTPGTSLHIKPVSQSYGVGLATGMMSGGWLADVGLANEATAGEGGAKRGEYEVSKRGISVVYPSYCSPSPCTVRYTCNTTPTARLVGVVR